jgi:hypothetical protein
MSEILLFFFSLLISEVFLIFADVLNFTSRLISLIIKIAIHDVANLAEASCKLPDPLANHEFILALTNRKFEEDERDIKDNIAISKISYTVLKGSRP